MSPVKKAAAIKICCTEIANVFSKTTPCMIMTKLLGIPGLLGVKTCIAKIKSINIRFLGWSMELD